MKFYVYLQNNAGGFFDTREPGRVIIKARTERAADNKFSRSPFSKIPGCNCGCGETRRFDGNAWEFDNLHDAQKAGNSFDRPDTFIVLY